MVDTVIEGLEMVYRESFSLRDFIPISMWPGQTKSADLIFWPGNWTRYYEGGAFQFVLTAWLKASSKGNRNVCALFFYRF